MNGKDGQDMRTKRHMVLRSLILMLLIIVLSGQCVFAAEYHYLYYGNHLTNTTDRTVYKKLRAAAANGNSTATFTTQSNSVNPYMAMILKYDNPEMYWIGSYTAYYKYTVNAFGEILSSYEFTFEPVQPWSGAYRKRAVFQKAVNKALKKIKKYYGGKSKVKQLKAVLKYIALTCSYKQSSYDQTAYAVFVKKKAVCAGYARAFKLLCDKLKIPCITVSATYKGTGHEFNYVKIGKSWYYVDPTWCDQGKTVTYKYFLLGKENSGCSTLGSSLGVKLPGLAKKDYY